MNPTQQIAKIRSNFEDYKLKMSAKLSALEKELAGGSASSTLPKEINEVVKRRREIAITKIK